jgi:hypothetical protein
MSHGETGKPTDLLLAYSGPSIFARMLQEALAQQDVGSIVRAAEPMRGLLGDAALPPFEEVFIARGDWEERREVIEACLGFVRHEEGEPLEEAGEAE